MAEQRYTKEEVLGFIEGVVDAYRFGMANAEKFLAESRGNEKGDLASKVLEIVEEINKKRTFSLEGYEGFILSRLGY